jgi:DNA-binding transcriptional MerR regulator
MRQTFSAGITSRVTGVPYRTLDYWARSRFIVPSGREASGIGSERRYTFDDLIALRTARELRSAGISTQALRRVIRFLQKWSVQKPLSELRVIIRGKDVLSVRTNQELVSVLKSPGQYAFSFFLDVGHIVNRVEEELKSLRVA